MITDQPVPLSTNDPLVRRVETDGHDKFVVDFGASATPLTADVIDKTVIIVGPNDEQREFELPTAEASTFIRNGVLTIEMKK